MSGKIKLGVFGAGRGRTMMDYCKADDRVELVAVCDQYAPLLNKVKERDPEGKIALFEDFGDFIKSGLDAVVLANYANEHAPYAIRCLSAGVHVMSEVLPVQTMKEAVALIEAAENSKAIYDYAENYCYMAAPREMRRLYREGKLGNFEYGESEYVHDCEPIWPALTQGNPMHWRNLMYSTFYCTHSIGPILHMTGLRPIKVTGFETPINDKKLRTGARSAAMGIEMIELDNGGYLRSLHGVAPSRDSYWFCAYGTKGRLESARYDAKTGGEDTLYVNIDGEDDVRVVKPEHDASYGHGGSDYFTMRYFIDRILGDENAETINVYEALDMFLPGMFAYRSILAGGLPMEVPNLRSKEERDKWREDTFCSDPRVAGEQLAPSYSKGDPCIPDETYARVRELFLAKEKQG